MGLKVPQASFAAGELDPVLHERTTLAKYDSGLSTGRNAIIGKTGSVMSRMGRKHFIKARYDDGRACIGYVPRGTNYLLEWGDQYVRVYNYSTSALIATTAHALTEAMLEDMHFESSGDYTYVWVYGQVTLKLNHTTGSFVATTSVFEIPSAPGIPTVTVAGAGSGYNVQYYVTRVKNGEESLPRSNVGTNPIPVAAGDMNTLVSVVAAGSTIAQGSDGVTEMRVYRRPVSGGAYGYIGSSTYFYDVAGDTRCDFKDIGQDADYAHNPPDFVSSLSVTATPNRNWKAKTGCIYQQRLLQAGIQFSSSLIDLEGIIASRPGYQNNYSKEYPSSADSFLKFKAGSSGTAEVLRMIDHDGLVVFTASGVFLHSGALSPDNISLIKKGKWIIKPEVPPLSVPGGLFFVDASSNTIRNLVWSNQVEGFTGGEISTFSNHLFQERDVVSWGFHEGRFPILFCNFDDGEFAAFTYEFDQEMRAWMRADSQLPVRQIIPTGRADKTFFLVQKDDEYFFEYTAKRFVSADDLADDPEAHMKESIAYMDGITTYDGILNGDLAGADIFELTPVVADDWEGDLTLTCGTSAVFAYAVGTKFRVFDPNNRTAYTLTMTAHASDNEVTVVCDREFDEQLKEDFRLYLVTTSSISSLDYLEGEYPAVIVDGDVYCSPNNTVDDYEMLQVVGGVLTFPAGFAGGAIIHIGRPIVGDVGTLKIATVEQAPTLIESITVNKVYVKTHQSRGLFIGHKFPDHESVETMRPLTNYDLDLNQEAPVVPNRYEQPVSRRYEITLPGEWGNQGEICLRQVDPVHFHIVSIIPDVTILKRGDR